MFFVIILNIISLFLIFYRLDTCRDFCKDDSLSYYKSYQYLGNIDLVFDIAMGGMLCIMLAFYSRVFFYIQLMLSLSYVTATVILKSKMIKRQDYLILLYTYICPFDNEDRNIAIIISDLLNDKRYSKTIKESLKQVSKIIKLSECFETGTAKDEFLNDVAKDTILKFIDLVRNLNKEKQEMYQNEIREEAIKANKEFQYALTKDREILKHFKQYIKDIK